MKPKTYNDHYKNHFHLDEEAKATLPLIYRFLYYFRFKTRQRENTKTPLISIDAYNTDKAVADASYKLISGTIDLTIITKQTS